LKKAQHGSKRCVDNNNSFEEFSSEGDESSKGLTSNGTSSPSQIRRKKINHSKNQGLEDFKKAKPPTFDGEIEKGEEEEVWLLGLNKYFKVHDYSENLKSRITIFNFEWKGFHLVGGP